ncbi:hypothetical protein IMG5_194970 [Ichthyophthirius multifiliis]|uniref:Uncharacterized protein n=1 Tax=Ichthyophthirius multifiliis TaxID=5932 RepID=G0R4V1_ICHMU|nr:hypothetical protein IMG5_194970 [Ichthyophthirius multifiliis]EGR27494.1 hypothetical protein IMG5_194970 [Ichthyophthirius multifiliis]|eukprot:XP_004024404.1 hypothetical protein IMG5_194970 [Ichthyophthirius multifiliis]
MFSNNIQQFMQELQKNKEVSKKEFDDIKYIENKKIQPLKTEDIEKYLPKLKTKEELYQDLKLKQKLNWKSPGYTNSDFNKIPILRANLLRNQDFDRMYMSERSYKFPINYKGIKIPTCAKEFGDTDLNLLPEQFQEYLKQNSIKKVDWRFRPSKYGKISLDYNYFVFI